MNHASGDKDHVTGFDFDNFITEADLCVSTQNVLLMLDRIGVTGHPAARQHGKFPQGEIWSLLRRDQDLNGRAFPGGDVFSFDFF
jgi:hypothetical protein